MLLLQRVYFTLPLITKKQTASIVPKRAGGLLSGTRYEHVLSTLFCLVCIGMLVSVVELLREYIRVTG